MTNYFEVEDDMCLKDRILLSEDEAISLAFVDYYPSGFDKAGLIACYCISNNISCVSQALAPEEDDGTETKMALCHITFPKENFTDVKNQIDALSMKISNLYGTAEQVRFLTFREEKMKQLADIEARYADA